MDVVYVMNMMDVVDARHVCTTTNASAAAIAASRQGFRRVLLTTRKHWRLLLVEAAEYAIACWGTASSGHGSRKRWRGW